MEQTTQQVSQKTSFPIATRIVGVLMLLISGAEFIRTITGLSDCSPDWTFLCLLWAGVCIIFFVAGLLILLKKRFGWWLAIIMFFIATTYVIWIDLVERPFMFMEYTNSWFFMIYALIDALPTIFVVPIVILLFDRKNFFKIAS